MTTPNFTVDQSLFDSFIPQSLKSGHADSGPKEDLNEANSSSSFQSGPAGLADWTSLTDDPLFFQLGDPLGLSGQSANIVPYLDEETPGSTKSISLSPHSPVSSSNTANPAFESEQIVSGSELTPRVEDSLLLSQAASHEKRKAPVAPISDTQKNAKIPKPAPKKPGRKADAEPVSKRKAQNRAAQRAFRERKEKRLKELEDRISELEAESQTSSNENQFLKDQVTKLEKELRNYRSKSQTSPMTLPSSSSSQFTFEFPFFQGIQNKHSSPVSLKSSQSEESSPNFSTHNSVFGSVSSASSSPPFNFCDKLNQACGNSETFIPQDTSLLKKNPSEDAETPSLLKITNPLPTLNNESTIDQNLIAPPAFELDFLSEYRDPIFDNEDFSLPNLTTEQSIFDPLDSLFSTTDSPALDSLTGVPVTGSSGAIVKEEENLDEETVPANHSKLMNCAAIWDRISAHPKFGNIDIDGLCAELRTKAKCSEGGVVMSEHDVTKVLSTLHA